MQLLRKKILTILTKGRNELINKIEQNLKIYRAQIKCKPTSGIAKYAKGDRLETRTAEKNTIIFRTLKKKRDPVFFTQEQDNKFKIKWQNAINDFIKTSNTIAFQKSAQEIADEGIKIIKKNIVEGKSEGGKMKPVQPRYQKIKDRMYGKNLPVLVRTGQLVKSLYSEVVTQ